MKEPETKCSELGFEHAGINTTPNIVYATYPPQYPPREETCRNCGLKRTHHETVSVQYSYQPKQTSTLTIDTTDIVGMDSTTTIHGDTHLATE